MQSFILIYFSILTLCSCYDKKFLNIIDLFDILTNEIILPNTSSTNFLVPRSSFDAEHSIGMIGCIVKDGMKNCVFNGKISYFGYYCENQDISISIPFNIGSISKLFGAATLLCVLQDKPEYFPDDLDTKLEFYLPFLKKTYSDYSFIEKLENRLTFSKMRLKDVLQHTSGIGNFDFGDKNNYNGDKLETEDGFCTNILNDTEYDKFSYTNVGYNLVNMILQAITGKSYSLLLKEYILIPLNLKETFTILDLVNKQDRIGLKKEFGDRDLAQSYSYYNGSLYFCKTFNWDTAIAGLYSTVGDLLTFVNNFYLNDGNLIFNEKTRELRDTQPVKTNTDRDYGIGQIYFANGWRGHNGGDMGVTTFVAYDFKTNISSVAAITSESLSSSLADIILAKGYKENIPNNRLSQAYLDKRYKIVETLRKRYSIRELVTMHRSADNNPYLFYNLYNLNYYAIEEKCM